MTQLKPEHRIYYKGRRNVYACAKCKHKFATIDLVKGVTPFTVTCPNCQESPAQSSFYGVPQDLLATQEWYKPDADEYATLDPDTKDHVDRGGLLIRPVPEETLKVLRAIGSHSEKMPPVMVATVNLDKPMGMQITQEHF